MAKPFTISIPNSQLEDLNQRLSLARFPDELQESAWDLGVPLADVKRLVNYWQHDYDWRKAEAKLNQFPHFMIPINVDGFGDLDIHFLHQTSSLETAIPLVFVHGWPGSFLEGTKFFNHLSGDGVNDPAFHVVVISLPNFGFSQGVKQRGFALAQYAEATHNLMLKLGYDEYVTQGGDWGFYVTRTMSLLYPDHCKATHINFDYGGGAPTFSQYPLLALEHSIRPYSTREKKGLERTQWFHNESSGYRAIQATKPQTVGYALTDSPVALIGWLWEKLHDWSDSYPWTDDELCTWLSIYWFSTAGPYVRSEIQIVTAIADTFRRTASLRIYQESTHTWKNPDPKTQVTRARTGEWIDRVKIGYSHQPQELRIVPTTWIKKLGNLVFDRYNDRGGHFFAYETPDQLVRDVRDMFRRGGGAYGVLESQTGYYIDGS